MSINHLKRVLSITPSLVHLKLIYCTRWSFESIFDGDFWKEFIQTKLPLLDKFDFVFTCLSLTYTVIQSLSSPIISFQTPFWLNDKHWFVTYDIAICSFQTRIIIYSLPIHTTMEPGILIRRKASSMDDVRLLNRRCINGIVTTEDVSIKEFHTII